MNYKMLIPVVLIVNLHSSCSRDSTPNPTPVDTLAAGWKKITMPTKDFTDIFFVNNTVFAVSDNGLYRSTDGGTNWQNVYPTSHTGNNMGMGSEVNVAIAGGSNRILFSKNGGNSFDSVTVNDQLSDVFFINATTAYAVGKSLWKTTNGGTNWTKLYDFTQSVYRSLHFVNELNGWMAGNAASVFKTTNGGVNWESKTVGFGMDFTAMGNPFFTDQNNGYVTDGSSVAKTTNGGTSWSKVFTANNSSFVDLHFITADIGYVTDGKYLFKTTNGGSTWTKELVLQDNFLYEIHFTDGNHGWACGGGGILKYEK